MSKPLNSSKMSQIIQEATQELIALTDSFLDSVKDEPVGEKPVEMMINGERIALSPENYSLLKQKKAEIKAKMKADLRAVADEARKPETPDVPEAE